LWLGLASIMYDPTKPYKKEIIDLIKKTWNTPYVSIKEGTYPVIEKKFSFLEVDHTDGIGTKGIYHWNKRTFRNAVIDALAMNLNDLAMMRAVPYKLQNHIIIPKDDHEAILEIVSTLVDECLLRDIAITGGETSVQNNINGMDISLTASGFLRNEIQNIFEAGNILVGLKSNGLHSNGFTKVREIFGEGFKIYFVEPTAIYSDKILKLDNKFKIHGMQHITGGAFTKFKDSLKAVDLIIRRDHKLKPQKIFSEVYEKGVSDEEMYKTFNCGIGFVLSVAKEYSEDVAKELSGEIIGEVTFGNGKVKIESMFSNKVVEF